MEVWEKTYKPRKWKTYVVGLSSQEAEFLRGLPELPQDDIICCASDSERANKLKSDPRRFYCDYELVAADLEPTFGIISFSRLDQDWQGHKKGALVLCVPVGVRDNPPTFTYMVEVIE